jgi:hypothetical protein
VARTLQGHLKEQDGLIQFLIDLHKTHTPGEVMDKMERWIREHRQQPRGSTLSQLIPTIGEFWTNLNLVRPPPPSLGPSPCAVTARTRVGSPERLRTRGSRRKAAAGPSPICRVTHLRAARAAAPPFTSPHHQRPPCISNAIDAASAGCHRLPFSYAPMRQLCVTTTGVSLQLLASARTPSPHLFSVVRMTSC